MESRVTDLNRGWRLIDGNDKAEYVESGIPESKSITVDLPCFTHMYIKDHLGISWYEKIFVQESALRDGERAWLSFEAAVFRTVVWVNGIRAGEHTGAEDPFAFDVTELLLEGENRITVRISKPYDESVDGYTFGEIPHRNQTPHGLNPGSCFNESGLCGEVSLKILPAVFIVELNPVPDPESGEIRCEITVMNTLAEPIRRRLTLEVHRAPEGETEERLEWEAVLAPGQTTVKASLRIPSPRLWSTAEPNLYAVRAEVGSHSAVKKCGFRTFEVGNDGYFYLNGRRVYLRCSHTGNCFPESVHNLSRDPELLRRDFLMAKAAGFNMIRFISGAALPLQLDLCDEIGLMIYEEPIGSWCTKNGTHTAELYRHNLLSMIRRDRSHPCITVWGLLNETKSEEPDNILFETARDILPELRKLDADRLVLLSSGRWDKCSEIGSVCNPGSRVWQKLWGYDGEDCSAQSDLGDIHYYPNPVIPMGDAAVCRMRSIGKGTAQPVFLSETGIGSALDTVQLTRRFAMDGANPICPDVQMIHTMNKRFHGELEKYGLAADFPMPSELMRGSMRNHAYYREQMFDLIRSNPGLNGVSLTGLLDHSICGEGLWTLHRRFKPMIADVLQDGFAPLRWNVILSKPALFSGESLTVEGSLASEDVLKVGDEYTAVAGIFDRDGGARDVRHFRFRVKSEDARRMVIPVFEGSWDTSGLAEGEYEFKAELLEADASGGIRLFHVCCPVEGSGCVYTVGMSKAEEALLVGMGFNVRPISAYAGDGRILAGHTDAQTAKDLRSLVEAGASAVVLRAAEEGDEALSILPEVRRPRIRREVDWLYHRETVLRPHGRFFSGMRTGLADARLYTGLLTPVSLEADGEAVPDETDAISFVTGHYAGEDGCIGGWRLASFKIGKGRLTVNTLNLPDAAGTVPYAARLLANLVQNA